MNIETLQIKRITSVEGYTNNKNTEFVKGELVAIDIPGTKLGALKRTTGSLKTFVMTYNTTKFLVYCHITDTLENILGSSDAVVYVNCGAMSTLIGTTIINNLNPQSNKTGDETTGVISNASNGTGGSSTKLARADHSHGIMERTIWETLHLPDSELNTIDPTDEGISNISQQRLRKITYGTDDPTGGAEGDIYIKIEPLSTT